ncbi:MAG: hypothetical protein JJ992_01005, partial [Planctomycetes bacterium]|nr:hypothetical protein [Planctomycetota bacterium]
MKLPPGRLTRIWLLLRRRDVVARIGICALMVVLLLLVMRGWAPPFAYRSGYIPAHDIPARTAFALSTERGTEQLITVDEILARAGRPLSTGDIQKLYAEYMAVRAQDGVEQLLGRAGASVGIYILLLVICGCYLHVYHRRLLADLSRLAVLSATVVMIIGLSRIAASDAWRAESIPLIVFGLTIAIAFDRPLALLLGAAVSLLVSLSLGQSLTEYLLLASSVVVPTLMVSRVRSRTKLIHVGVLSGSIVFVVAVCVSGLAGQAYGIAHSTHVTLVEEMELLTRSVFAERVAAGAAWYGLCVVLAGFLMTGLLPFLERLFDVQTDIRLLELGDAAHPLLRQLAQRAPGTYNHSINVASIGESAAEAIGADGLLVRVGA